MGELAERSRRGQLRLAAAAAAALALSACSDADGRPCQGYCGPGTVCVADVCVVDGPEQKIEATEEDEKGGKKRRKRRRGRKGGGDDGEFVDGEELPPFQPVDDSGIPKFKRAVDQKLSLKGSGGRLSDGTVNQHLKKLERKFQTCIETAATYSADYVGGGAITYEFRIEPSGKVSSVSAKAPAKLSVFGVIPCVRKAIYTHRFPSFEGLSMAVDSSFRVD